MTTRAFNSLPSPEALIKRYSWTGLLNGDDGSPLAFAEHADRSIQVTGTFGAGGSISLEGSNDGGTTWVILKDPLGQAITFTAAGLKPVGDLAYQVRPHVTAGDGTTTLAAYIVMRSGAR